MYPPSTGIRSSSSNSTSGHHPHQQHHQQQQQQQQFHPTWDEWKNSHKNINKNTNQRTTNSNTNNNSESNYKKSNFNRKESNTSSKYSDQLNDSASHFGDSETTERNTSTRNIVEETYWKNNNMNHHHQQQQQQNQQGRHNQRQNYNNDKSVYHQAMPVIVRNGEISLNQNNSSPVHQYQHQQHRSPTKPKHYPVYPFDGPAKVDNDPVILSTVQLAKEPGRNLNLEREEVINRKQHFICFNFFHQLLIFLFFFTLKIDKTSSTAATNTRTT
jgi:hypothetical protein